MDKEKTAKCTICEIKVLSKYLSKHMRRVHLELYKIKECDYCDRTFENIGDLKIHVKARHFGKKPVSCKDCDFKSTSRSSMQAHVKRKHNQTRCDDCDQKFEMHTKYLRHRITAHGDKVKNACELCEFVAMEKKSLTVHMNRKHLKVKPFACDVCDFRSTTKGTVDKHKRQIHLKLKPFQCP